MKKLQATMLLATNSTLGEGPLWHAEHKMLYWVDIEQKIVHAFEPHTGRHRTIEVPKRVGTVTGASNGKLIVGLQGEIAELDPNTGRLRTITLLEPDLIDNRCNDGKCDPAGRLWVGTMQLETRPKMGSLYCIGHDLIPHRVLSGLTISNGMGWSPDGQYMYFIDSADYKVRRYRYSNQAILKEERIVLAFEKDLPDGMCVDSDGNLWIGFWGASRVGCYDPTTGEHLLDVHVPAPHVTSCCFGGDDLKTLYITTAREGLSEDQLKEFPLSGCLFTCKPGASGMHANNFSIGE
jgi:sugar lactone lactonase YvrE